MAQSDVWQRLAPSNITFDRQLECVYDPERARGSNSERSGGIEQARGGNIERTGGAEQARGGNIERTGGAEQARGGTCEQKHENRHKLVMRAT